ncbi:MAG: DNA polymerase III subunit gamma/tau [Candidatus Kapaibacteriota bacterium]
MQNDMGFIVTARKWRPLRFDEVIGQEHITQTLKNAVRFGRIHHAYLFTGPRGVGKTTTARLLSRVVNCKNVVDGEPCNQCDSCLSILEGRSLDVIEIDGASNNSVDDIRTLRENAKYPPIAGKYKIYIIDEVHMLSTSAFNALLKILEEPPKHLIFVFATTEPHKVLPTIVSRCQRFDFHRLEVNTIRDQISKIAEAEGIKIDEMSLFTIAKKADGSMRDAQSVFDQFVASAGNEILYEKVSELLHLIDSDFYFKVSDAFHKKDSAAAFEICEALTKNGYDYSEFLVGLLEHFRNIFYLKVTQNVDKVDAPRIILNKYLDEARKFNEKDLLRIMNLISNFEQQIKFSSIPRIRVELLLLQIIEMPNIIELNELIKEIQNIKQKASPILLTNETPSIKQEQYSASDKTQALTTEHPKWEEFLNIYGNKLNGLKSFYNSRLIDIEFRTKQILVLAKNEVVYENLTSKKRAFKQAIKEFFGENFELEIIFAEKNSQDTNFVENATNPMNNKTKTLSENESIIEKTLKEYFNAREIPLP